MAIYQEETVVSEIHGFVESGPVKIHYLAKNRNPAKPLSLLFIPGIMMPAYIWEKQLNYFSKSYHVVAVDIRCQGDSDQSVEGHDAFSIAKDIKAVVDKLELKPVILIGWSLAVPALLNYAVHFDSEELIGLVLVDGIAGIDPDVPFYQAMIDRWSPFPHNRMEKTEEFIASLFKQPQPKEFLSSLKEAALRMPTQAAMTFIQNYMFQDFRSLLSCIDTPTWIATIDGPRLDYMKKMQAFSRSYK
jgi:non-heme chloroperoxidase